MQLEDEVRQMVVKGFPNPSLLGAMFFGDSLSKALTRKYHLVNHILIRHYDAGGNMPTLKSMSIAHSFAGLMRYSKIGIVGMLALTKDNRPLAAGIERYNEYEIGTITQAKIEGYAKNHAVTLAYEHGKKVIVDSPKRGWKEEEIFVYRPQENGDVMMTCYPVQAIKDHEEKFEETEYFEKSRLEKLFKTADERQLASR